MPAADLFAAILFMLSWIFYPSLAVMVSGKAEGAVNSDMQVIRSHWVRRMLGREVRITDTNILSQLLNSATFFASSNLLVIAAAAGALLGGEDMIARLSGLTSLAPAPFWLIEVKIGLIILTLARALLDFIWSIRQVNYAMAIVGAAPEADRVPDGERFVDAATGVLNGAVHAFNTGVRGYYFSLAAAAWLVSAWAMAIGVFAAVGLLLWRQTASPTSRSIHKVRVYLDAFDRDADK